MRVLTTEGRRSAESLFRFACAQWPECDIAVVDVCFPYFAKNYLYPRTLRYQDLPLVRPAQYKISEPLQGQESQSIKLLLRFEGVVSDRHVPTLSDLIALCSNATSVTFADRLFYQPAMTFQLFVEHFTPHLAEAENLVLDTMAQLGGTPLEALSDALAEGLTTKSPRFIAAIDEARVKRYFDYNFHLNGNVVLGDLYRRLSGMDAPIHMSKNMLLVLYLIRKLESVEECGLLHIMGSWRGWREEGDTHEIGTVPSRQSLVPNLVGLGLVKTEALPSALETISITVAGVRSVHTRNYHSLTDLGARFLESLHPACYDPFLPRRLEEWQGKGMAASKAHIERYIKTYFGKQIRFQSKLFRA